MSSDLPRLRVEYGVSSFGPRDVGSDPMRVFETWLEAAIHGSVVEANAMALATVGADGTPSVRMVLLKDLDPVRASFTFYTNLDSRKSTELGMAGGRAALCWWWPTADHRQPGRQVRVVGMVEAVDRAEASRYFASRPVAAQVGAAASPQSRAVASREVLLERVAALEAIEIDLPDRWGGWRLVADELEFWQGRAGRLHDRVTFLRLDGDGHPCSVAGRAAAGGEAALQEAGEMVVDGHGTRWLRARLAP